MKVGDKVKTHYGEEGTIVRPVSGGTVYDWWIDIPVKGTGHICTEPYRESELTVSDNQSISTDQSGSNQVADSSTPS